MEFNHLKMHCIIIFTAIIFAACTSRNVQEVDGVLVVDVSEVVVGEDIPVETLADEVEVIPLETADGAFFEFRSACFSENFVVVRAANGLVRIFGRNGRFVGLLEGVDERTAVYDIAIDEGRGAIYASTISSDRLLVFDLAGHRQPDIMLQSHTSKAVLVADSCGVALAQFDFTDMPSGFNAAIMREQTSLLDLPSVSRVSEANAAIIGKDGTRHTSRPSLCIQNRNSEGFISGFNHEIVGSSPDDQLHFMTTFCDTLFRYNAKENSIVPELAVNMSSRHGTNIWEAMQDTAQTKSWIYAIALPRHYVVSIIGANAQTIIVDKERLTAIRASIAYEGLPKLQFADSYAYTLLPPNGKDNSILIRWKLSDKPKHKPAPKPDLPQTKTTTIVCDEKAVTASIALSEQNKPEAAMAIIDSVIATVDVKCGHPALAYAYAMKSVLHTQLAQFDSADYYRHLVNAPLSIVQQRIINRQLMQIYTQLGDTENAQKYAVAYGTTRDDAQGGSADFISQNESQACINNLNQQVDEGSRLRVYLLSVLAIVLIAASATILILRRQKRKQIAATRRELQTLMEQRIEAITADKEESQEKTNELRAEIMKNHALIRRISNTSVTSPLSVDEQDLLHRIAEMLYSGLTARLQSKAATPLNKRELTICYLIRFGVPQLSIGVLLDVKPASFRVIKSNLKRDRFRLPIEAELEDFIQGM